MSIRVKIIILFLGVVLIPFVTIAAFMYVDVKVSTQRQAIEKLDALATVQKNRTRELINKYVTQISQFNSRLQLRIELNTYNRSKSPSSLTKLNQIISETKKGTKNIKDISIINADGIIVASTDKQNIGTNVSNTEYFQKGEKQIDISVFEKDVDKTVYLYLTGPLIYNDKLIGTTAIKVKTDDLFGIFKDYTGLGTTGSWGLAKRLENGDGLIVVPGRFDTNPDSPLKSKISKSTRVPLIQALQGEEKIFTDIKDYRGKEVIAATRYIPEMGWGIGVIQEKSEILDSTQNVLNQFLFFGILLILFVIFVGSLLSQIIIAPIHSLSQAAQKIASGDLSVQTKVSTRDEIGSLAQIFNQMVVRLKDAHENLEEKIAQRTEELEKFRQTIANATDGVLMTDKNGQIIYANHAWEIMTGYPQNEVLGKNPKFLQSGKTPPEVFTKMWQKIKSEEVFKTEDITNKRKDGTEYQAQLQIFPIKSESNNVFYVELSQDISKRYAVERAKTEFLTLTSHELRNPLTSIRWSIEMLYTTNTKSLSSFQKKYLNNIDQGNKKMIDLVNSLLSLSRVQTGVLPYDPKPLNVSALIDTIVSQLHPEIKKKKLSIHTSIPGSLTKYTTDEKLFNIVLQNIISNAVRYNKTNGKVYIQAETNKTHLTLQIKDTGIGIESGDEPNIFTKLFRAKNAEKAVSEGNGIGLYMSKSIVEFLGGKLSFTSVANRGTTFTIQLPLHFKAFSRLSA